MNESGSRSIVFGSSVLDSDEANIQNSTEFEVFPEDLLFVDIQGFAWSTPNSHLNQHQLTRQQYRQRRIANYNNFRNIPSTSDELALRADLEKNVRGGDSRFFCFKYTTRTDVCSMGHFQLRHLLRCTSPQSVYYTYLSKIRHFNPLTTESRDFFNIFASGFPFTKIICLSSMHDNWLVAGGFDGELLLMPTISAIARDGGNDAEKEGDQLESNMLGKRVKIFRPCDDNPSTPINHISCREKNGDVLLSENDGVARLFDLNQSATISSLDFDFPVNCSVVQPAEENAFLCVGDSRDVFICDWRCGSIALTMKDAFFDYSFSGAWHPSGYLFAVGSQDCTCKVWDLRQAGSQSSLAILPSSMGGVRAVEYSSNGEFLAVGESDDFVNLYSTGEHINHRQSSLSSTSESMPAKSTDCNEYDGAVKRQTIDFLGECTGISFSTDWFSNSLFIGVGSGVDFGGIIEFERISYRENFDRFI